MGCNQEGESQSRCLNLVSLVPSSFSEYQPSVLSNLLSRKERVIVQLLSVHHLPSGDQLRLELDSLSPNFQVRECDWLQLAQVPNPGSVNTGEGTGYEVCQ